MRTYEFRCTPPNEASRIVQITAATLEEAVQRAERLWCRQMHAPILLGSFGAAERCLITRALTAEASRYYGDANYRDAMPWSELPS